MKRLVTAIILILMVIGISVFESCYVSHVSKKVETNLNSAFDCYQKNNLPQTAFYLSQAQNTWDNSRGLLNSLLIHNYTENISEEIITAVNTLKYDTENFPIECQKTIIAVKDIRYSMIPYVENIL